jgi:hypothetical protein
MPLSKYVVDNRRFTAHDDHYVRVKFQLQCIFVYSIYRMWIFPWIFAQMIHFHIIYFYGLGH